MTELVDFRGNPQWDWRAHPAQAMVFHPGKSEGAIAEIKRRALTVLRSYCEGAGMSEVDLDGPFWALIDTSYGSEKVAAACRWFRLAAQSGEDEETRRAMCFEAYGKVERATRCYL